MKEEPTEQKFEIEIEKVIPEKRTMVKYDRDMVERRLEMLIKQRDDFTTQLQKQIDEQQAILGAMDKAGIISKTTFIAAQAAEKEVQDGLKEINLN
jgi:heterodisulfide reductase subunit C